MTYKTFNFLDTRGSTSYINSTRSEYVGTVRITQIQCNGKEPKLQSCEKKIFSPDYVTNFDMVGVSCNSAPGMLSSVAYCSSHVES